MALPTDMFYNTNIATYLWFMSNRKPKERKGKVILIDATRMGVVMKKNLGKKRYELSVDCNRRIVEAYHNLKAMEWTDSEAVAGRRRALKAKVFPTSHFFYRKVTVERPLRMRFEITPTVRDSSGELGSSGETRIGRQFIASEVRDAAQALDYFIGPAFKKLSADELEQLKCVAQALRSKDAAAIWTSADAFRLALQEAADDLGKKAKLRRRLSAKQLEAARKSFGIRDKKAEISTNEKGEIIPDADLRDAEYVPFSVVGNDVPSGIITSFDAEVKPHWPDAWVNENVCDDSDGQVGVVGCEINFNREFYDYVPPRSREEIHKDIEAMEKRFLEMLQGVKG